MKVKVINDNIFPVGMKLMDNVRELVIRPKSFLFIEQDEVQYIDSVSKLFKEGIIYCEDTKVMEEMGHENNPNLITEEEIKKALALSVSKIKEAFKDIEAKHTIDKIVEIVKKSDLTQSKIKAIEELFNVKIFEDLGEEVI